MASPTAPSIKVYIQLGNTDFTAFTLDSTTLGVLDTDLLAADSAGQDVSDDVLEFSVDRGKNSELNEYQTGTATIKLDNSSGNYDPQNSASPWFNAILPLRKIRIAAIPNGDTREIVLFTGRVKSWDIQTSDYGAWSWVDLQCADAFEELANLYLLSGVVRPAETTGTRLGAILDDYGLEDFPVVLDDGLTTVDAATVPEDTNVLDYAHDLALSEGDGDLFVNAGGELVFNDRQNNSFVETSTTTEGGYITWPDQTPTTFTNLTVADAPTLNYNFSTTDYVFFCQLRRGTENRLRDPTLWSKAGWPGYQIVVNGESGGTANKFQISVDDVPVGGLQTNSNSDKEWTTDFMGEWVLYTVKITSAANPTFSVYTNGQWNYDWSATAIEDVSNAFSLIFSAKEDVDLMSWGQIPGAFSDETLGVLHDEILTGNITAIQARSPSVYFDFRSTTCYPGTGTTVTDLSANGNNGTLAGTTTWGGEFTTTTAVENEAPPVLSDTGTNGSAPYDSMTENNNATDNLYNKVVTQRPGGTQFVADDLDSQNRYGIRPLIHNDLLTNSEADAEEFGQFLLGTHSEPETKIGEISVCLDNLTPAQQATFLALDLTDLVTIERSPLSEMFSYVKESIIEGITIVGDPHRWDMRFKTSTTQNRTMLVLDAPVLGQLDLARLGW